MTPDEIRAKLEEFRKHIDKIDEALLIILNERAKVALDISD